MKGIKRFTQSITLLIVIPFTVFLIPWAIAKLLQLIGLWSAVDNLFPQYLGWFWSVFIATRYIFAAAWGLLGHLFIKYGKKYGFFWFEKNNSYDGYHKSTVDKSWEIFMIIFVAALVLVIAELAIYLSTGMVPPFSQ